MEFTPEHRAPIIQANHDVAGLRAIEFDICFGESARLEWIEWVGVEGILQALERLRDDRSIFGRRVFAVPSGEVMLASPSAPLVGPHDR